MIHFVGGPYDGRKLPLRPPFARTIRLPREDELEAYFDATKSDPAATAKQDWPYVYEIDANSSPLSYRYVRGE